MNAKKLVISLATVLILLCGMLNAAEYDNISLPTKLFKNLNDGKKQTVVVYGTSLTIKGAWAKALNEYFDKQFPGLVTFHNSAKAGMHSNWGVDNLKSRVLDKSPDLVFIEFAINDAATKFEISTEKCESNLDSMVKSIQKQNPNVEIILQTMNPAWGGYANYRPNLQAYYEVYQKYARANHLPLIDHYPVWKKIQNEDPEQFKKMVPDGIHPSSTTSLEITYPAVEKFLEQARTAAGK